MRRDKVTGYYHFSGDEEDVAFRWMWECLLDTSLWGKIKLTWHIWRGRPPQRYFDDLTKEIR